ncbi:Protein tpx2 [Chytriomyces hyalinus]|nr:Protein tpx2 [Chytriomyces hyalinus]
MSTASKHTPFKPSRLANVASLSPPTPTAPPKTTPSSPSTPSSAGPSSTATRIVRANSVPSFKASPAPASTHLPPAKLARRAKSTVDPDFEFAAPHFCDFDIGKQAFENADEDADAWFETQFSSPLPSGSSFRPARPSTLLNQLDEEDDMPTPKASRPKTAAPARPPPPKPAPVQLRKPAKAGPSSARLAALSKPKQEAKEITRMFARLSLKTKPRHLVSDPKAKARLLMGTAASRARVASAAAPAAEPAKLRPATAVAPTSTRAASREDVLSTKSIRSVSSYEDVRSTTVSASSDAARTKIAPQKPRPAPSMKAVVPAARVVRGPTVPQEFSFASRSREKMMMTVKSPGLAKRRKPLMKKPVSELTVPKPFRFHETLHKSMAEPEPVERSPFVPLMCKVKQFQTDTPDRFRTAVKPLPPPAHVSRLTKPHSPALMTKQRAKPTTVKPTEEQIIDEIANYPRFKARPVDKKIMTEPGSGVPPPQKPSVTVPHSPHFTKPRITRQPSVEVMRPPSPPKVIKANPIRYAGVKPFEPVLERRMIVPNEVHLPGEEMRARKLREFEEAVKRQTEEDEKRRKFVARPLPDLSAVDPLPDVKPRAPTEPEPFSLLTETFSHRSAFQKSHDAAFDLSGRDLTATASGSVPVPAVPKFTAQPVPIVDPFVPKKSAKLPTIPEPVLLHTDVRVEGRREFEQSLKLRMAAEEEMRELARLENEEMEREQVRRLRQNQVFHAQPVRHFPGVAVHASQRKLTEPESPMLKDKRERLARMRTSVAESEPFTVVSGRAQMTEAYSSKTFDVVAVAAEGMDRRRYPQHDNEGDYEDEFSVPEGRFEPVVHDGDSLGDQAERGDVGRREWPRLQEWVDSDGAVDSDPF